MVNQSQEIAGLADTTLIGADGVKDGAMIKAAGDLAAADRHVLLRT